MIELLPLTGDDLDILLREFVKPMRRSQLLSLIELYKSDEPISCSTISSRLSRSYGVIVVDLKRFDGMGLTDFIPRTRVDASRKLSLTNLGKVVAEYIIRKEIACSSP